MDTAQKNTTYVYKSEHFEGPLDVLLSLIEKRKLLINQISLALVTEEFMKYTESLDGDLYIKEKTNFIVIASILLLIKARSLLPTIEVTEEETQDIVELEKRLKVLEFVRGLSKKIEVQYGKNIIYNQGNFKSVVCVFAPSKDISLDRIKEAVYRVLHKLPKPEKKMSEAKVRRVISIEDMMQTLSLRVKKAVTCTFTQFTKSDGSSPLDVKEKKQHVVISFLALLELIKQNMVLVEQISLFDEIDIKSIDINTPKY